MVVSYLTAAFSLTSLNCGYTPSGFNVITGSSYVNLTLYVANSNLSLGYQVQPTNGASVTLNACVDLVKNGDETDVDCGGSPPPESL